MQGYGFSMTRILPYKDKIYNFVLTRENTGQWKPVFSHILCSDIFNSFHYSKWSCWKHKKKLFAMKVYKDKQLSFSKTTHLKSGIILTSSNISWSLKLINYLQIKTVSLEKHSSRKISAEVASFHQSWHI